MTKKRNSSAAAAAGGDEAVRVVVRCRPFIQRQVSWAQRRLTGLRFGPTRRRR